MSVTENVIHISICWNVWLKFRHWFSFFGKYKISIFGLQFQKEIYFQFKDQFTVKELKYTCTHPLHIYTIHMFSFKNIVFAWKNSIHSIQRIHTHNAKKQKVKFMKNLPFIYPFRWLWIVCLSIYLTFRCFFTLF